MVIGPVRDHHRDCLPDWRDPGFRGGDPEGVQHINAKSRKVLKINWFSELFLFFTMQNKVVFGKKKRTYSWDFF